MKYPVFFALLVLFLVFLGCTTTQSRVRTQGRTEAVPANPPVTEAPTEPPLAANPESDALPGFSPVPPAAEPDKIVEPVKGKDGAIDWGAGLIRATGKGAMDPNAASKAQAMLMAERAATVDAQRKLLEIAQGVRVNGETMVEDYITRSDVVLTHVNGLVRNARQIGATKYDTLLGIVSVDLALNLYGSDGLADAVRPPEAVPVSPPPVSSAAVKALSGYSAIVIEGAGTNAKPALFPRLFDNKGNLLLDTRELVGRDARIGAGAIQFVESMDQILANPELARNPLVIKVRSYQGKYLSDYVIPPEQVNLLKTIKSAVPYLLKAGRFLLKLMLI